MENVKSVPSGLRVDKTELVSDGFGFSQNNLTVLSAQGVSTYDKHGEFGFFDLLAQFVAAFEELVNSFGCVSQMFVLIGEVAWSADGEDSGSLFADCFENS